MSKAITVQNLTKSYGENIVLKGISFDVSGGEIFALLGINGAGKTTALECLEDLRHCDSGKIDIRGKIGVQLQSSSLPPNIMAIEAVYLFAKWNKGKSDMTYLERLGIMEFKNTQYEKLSTGQKRRLHLCIGLLGNPDIVFLDEPAAGLDVEGRAALHLEIRHLKEQGKTIIMSSHDMAEVEELCDKIAILKDGKLAFLGTAEELTAKVGTESIIRIKTSHGEDAYATTNIVETLLAQLENYKRDKINILDIKIGGISLEERFMQFQTEKLDRIEVQK